MRPNATAAFIALCAVLCIGVAGGVFLAARGNDTGTYWAGLAALLTMLINLLRTEQTRKQVDEVRQEVAQVVKQTNGTNTRLTNAALTALADLPPERATVVLRQIGVTRPPDETMTTPPGDTHMDERKPLE